MADLSMSPDTGDTTPRAPEPGDLAVAVRLAEHTLDSRNPTATREALRILLRATLAQHAPNSHPDTDEALRRARGGAGMSEPKNLGSAHDLRALLTAVLEAITLPAGDVEYARRLETRANWVHATVKGALAEDPADIGWNADFLRQKLVEEQAAAEQRAVCRSVDAQFPAIAAFLADERGAQ